MDPLSITASAVAFLGVSGATAKFLRRVFHNANHAPNEILALSNDISDMSLIVNDLEANARVLEEAAVTLRQPISSSSISDHLEKARDTIYKLQAIAADSFTTLPDGAFKFRKFKWMRRQSEVASLRKDLIEVKQSLNAILSSRTASNVARIQLTLQGLELEHASNAVAGGGGGGGGQNPTPTQGVVFPGVPQQVVPAETNAMPGHADETIDKMMAAVRQISQFGTITLHLNRTVRCQGDCDCACHSRSQFQTPRFLEHAFGRLFVGYAGLLVFTWDCTRPTCTNQYSRAAKITYTFPSWLFLKTIDVTTALTYTNETHFGLKIGNRIPDGENSVFSLARSGNVPGIKDLYQRRLTSPNDLSYSNGQTALAFAVQCVNRLETVSFLLDVVGIDPFFKEDSGWCIAQAFSMDVLSRPSVPRDTGNDDDDDNNNAAAAAAIFAKVPGDHAEIWDFTYIHSIVVGIHHSELRGALLDRRYRDLVDVPDIFNRTPLYWAALRGDTAKAEILLAAGADPTRCDRDGSIPLHAAILSRCVACIELFLARDASMIHHRDGSGCCAIQIAAAFADDEPMLDALYLAGASVNVEMDYGTSALASAACCNRARNVEWLVHHGAHIDNPDVVGYTPLLEAIRYCNNAAVEVLLRLGARVDLKTKGNRTVLHVLAGTGTLECTELLLRHPIPLDQQQQLDVNARDIKNQTAWEVFENRVGPPTGMRDAFLRLLAKVKSVDAGAHNADAGIESDGDDDDDDDDCDVFEDAVE